VLLRWAGQGGGAAAGHVPHDAGSGVGGPGRQCARARAAPLAGPGPARPPVMQALYAPQRVGQRTSCRAWSTGRLEL